jgi:hypothetical protein
MTDTIYNFTDVNMLYQNIHNITDNINKIKSRLYPPSFEEKLKIRQIILDYIKEKKKKIYGGYALDKLLINKKYESIYKEYEIPDIDFYSIDPNTDIIELCNKFHELTYKVTAREAKHQNTYSIFVNYDLYCDITYAPSCVYNAIPTLNIDGFYYVNPNFMIIDYLKILTDPLSSYWRLEKSFERLCLLEEAYPLPKFTKEIEINSTEDDKLIRDGIDKILNQIKDINDIVIVGFYAYLYYLKISKLSSKNKNLENFSKKNYNEIPFIELITKNFKSDALKIINSLQEEYDITYTEYYPFFTFTGNSVEIYLNENLICIIYDYNNRPIPYIKFNQLKIASFSQVLLNAQINVIKYKTQKEEQLKYMYMIMVSHLIQMKSYYLKGNKKTIFDNTPFREFVLDFIHPEENPDHELILKYEKRKAKNKPSMFIYDPSKIKKEEKVENFFFPNISGNEITNEKRQRLQSYKGEETELEETELEEK